MKPTVLAYGEILIDFTPFTNQEGNPSFQQNPAGAPLNVLAALTNLGVKTGFIGCVGKDMFGDILKDFVKTLGIDDSYLSQTTKANTTLAFVQLYEDGLRDFSFYRRPGADQMLEEADIETVDFKGVKVFHFGSLSMTNEQGVSVTKRAIQRAKEAGTIISYDPNYREPLWPSRGQAIETILDVMDQVDILKVNDEELILLTGLEDIEAGAAYLAHKYHISLVMVTLGPDGCLLYHQDHAISVKGNKVDAIDTTGAGDSFTGTMIYHLLQQGDPLKWIDDELIQSGEMANAVAALVTTKYGSASIMPTQEEINAFLSR